MANLPQAQTYARLDKCVDAIIQRVGKDICLGLPLGLGKAVHVANALYDRACEDPSINLHIATALSLEKPAGSQSLEKRFMEPFVERVYEGVPDLHYVQDLNKGKLPQNVRLSEFYFKPGGRLDDPGQQQNYICTNYTHATRDLLAQGVNVVAQMVAPDPEGTANFSLSCNADLSLDIFPLLREQEENGRPIAVVAEVNDKLPWFGGTAEVPEETFDFIYDQPKDYGALFSVPNMAVSSQDHMVGFYASLLLRDGGTLQVGIGSLGVGLVYSAIFRHQDNGLYNELARRLEVADKFPVAARVGGTGPFEAGLYGCSEMMVDGFIYLFNAGILKRQVVEDERLQKLLDEGHFSGNLTVESLDELRKDGLINSPLRARDVHWLQAFEFLRPGCTFKGGQLTIDEVSLTPDLDDPEARELISEHALGQQVTGGVVMHGGFYLGPRAFYQELHDLTPEERARFNMTSVNYINHLYDHEQGRQALKTAQRRDARFINSAMMHTLNGAAVSDGLADGRVVSGVGGQYNFVAMAHELPGAHSVMTLRATRMQGARPVSNIVFNYPHCTIPRHLRDIVVTEYGIADLRGRPDHEVYQQLIQIADSRFQDELLSQAQKAGKVPRNWKVPPAYRQNTPERIEELLAPLRNHHKLFPPFPFSCDFTDEELEIGRALKHLKAATSTRIGLLKTLWGALRQRDVPESRQPLLQRMNLEKPDGWREKLDQRLLLWALEQH